MCLQQLYGCQLVSADHIPVPFELIHQRALNVDTVIASNSMRIITIIIIISSASASALAAAAASYGHQQNICQYPHHRRRNRTRKTGAQQVSCRQHAPCTWRKTAVSLTRVLIVDYPLVGRYLGDQGVGLGLTPSPKCLNFHLR